MAQALGASLMDAGGEQIAPGGAVLLSLAHIAVEHLDARLHECTFDVACDVTNPLCGPLGASAIYGPQKGATPAMVEELDHALVHYAEVIQRDVQMAVADIPGAGAAGGLGAGTITFLRGNLRPGAQIVNEALRVAERIAQADLVITAEGQLDVQTAYGKSVGAVAEIARAHAIPTLALAGSLGENYQAVYALGIAAVAVLPSGPMTLTYAMQNAADLLMDATERTCRAIKMGIDMRPT
jgi:glycerate kinase